MAIDLNKSDEYRAGDFSIFNEGNTGIVENVKGRVTKKGPEDGEKTPDYKIFVSDSKGEINDGFYYQTDPEAASWKDFQAQRLIRLCKGILGEEFEFPIYETPKDALDGVMKLIAPVIDKVPLRIFVTYGTTKRPSEYLRFKSFGRFIENMSEFPTTKLKMDMSDQMTRPVIDKTTEGDLADQMATASDETPPWMK